MRSEDERLRRLEREAARGDPGAAEALDRQRERTDLRVALASARGELDRQVDEHVGRGGAPSEVLDALGLLMEKHGWPRLVTHTHQVADMDRREAGRRPNEAARPHPARGPGRFAPTMNAIDAYLDLGGHPAVVAGVLSDAMCATASHVAEAWGDEDLADHWQRRAGRVAALATRLERSNQWPG